MIKYNFNKETTCITSCGDTNEQGVIVWLRTKSRRKADKILKDSKPVMLSNEELQDLWSALTTWEKHLDHKRNPITSAAITKLIKKVRSNI